MATRKRGKTEAEPKGRWVLYLPASKRLALQHAALDESARQGRRVTVSALLEGLVDEYLRRRGAK